ncbi:uncharacterized protein with beta-barrel porin domain [Xanthomonas sp. 3498]|nr:uncharacterized protein with beta-barrel porin domain [Xanthomonas sp. 3498]
MSDLAKANGLERIDQVLLSEQPSRAPAGAAVFVVQSELRNLAYQRVGMSTHVAINTSVEQSLVLDAGARRSRNGAEPVNFLL